MNRRQMLQATSAAAAAGLLQLPSRRVFGYQANETLNVAGIGTGGRFRHLMKAFKKIPKVRLVAVCDVWDTHLNLARELAEPGAQAVKNYHALLERKDIDAVIIASPDHWHVPMTVDACAAGKDVYVEKPLTHSLAEGQAVIDAQNRYKRIVQVGMQQRSMTHIRKAFEIIRDGKLGKIHKTHLTWNRNSNASKREGLIVDPKSVDWKAFLGNAPDQPFDAYRFRSWRWFWDFGGGVLTDLMVHWLDVVHWCLGLDHPTEAMTVGDQFLNKGLWETPDTAQTLMRYPDKELQVYFESTFVNARYGAMLEFMGTNGTLYIDRGRYELYPERRRCEPDEMILGEGGRGADFYTNPDGERLHLTDWIEAIRSRKKPIAPAEAGVSAAAAAHLANQSYRESKIARWRG